MPALRRSRRPIAVLLGFLLTLVVGEPLRAHDCAMHLGVRQAAAGEAQAGTSGEGQQRPEHEGRVGQREAHLTHASADPAETHSDDHGDRHACDCLGTCCTVAAVRLPSLPELAVSIAAPSEPALPTLLSSAPAPRAPRLLPFANGPPSPDA